MAGKICYVCYLQDGCCFSRLKAGALGNQNSRVEVYVSINQRTKQVVWLLTIDSPQDLLDGQARNLGPDVGLDQGPGTSHKKQDQNHLAVHVVNWYTDYQSLEMVPSIYISEKFPGDVASPRRGTEDGEPVRAGRDLYLRISGKYVVKGGNKILLGSSDRLMSAE